MATAAAAAARLHGASRRIVERSGSGPAAFEYVTVGSALHGADALRELARGFEAGLARVGGRPSPTDEPAHEDAPRAADAIVVLTGGTERQILAAWEARGARSSCEPLVLIAHGEDNSLPAAMEALARVRQRGGRGRILYLDGPLDERGLRSVAGAMADMAVWRRLQGARIGLVGAASDWLVASTPTPEAVRASWGALVVPIDLRAAIREIGVVQSPRVGARAGAVMVGARDGRAARPSDAEVVAAARLHPWLRSIVERERLDAISVRCFDLIGTLQTTSCLAFAELGSERVIAGCEGDLVSTIGMLWLRSLLDEQPWMANPARVDPERNAVLLAHCTVPLSSVRAYHLRTHFESGTSVGIQGELPPGPVTLVRIGGEDLRDLWLADGEALPTVPREHVCRTQLEVALGGGAGVEDLLLAPLGNHIVTVRGHHAERLRAWWRTFVAA